MGSSSAALGMKYHTLLQTKTEAMICLHTQHSSQQVTGSDAGRKDLVSPNDSWQELLTDKEVSLSTKVRHTQLERCSCRSMPRRCSMWCACASLLRPG